MSLSRSEKPALLIISDSPMWLDPSGLACVYEPTLREVESLLAVFEDITWLGYQRQGYAFGTGRAPVTAKVRLVMLKASGGETILSKLLVFFLLPYYFASIGNHVRHYQFIHTRGPSIPSLVGILFNFLFRKKKFWHKFAGNWEKPSARVYALQKEILSKITYSRVTINGAWPGQPSHILSFENPCISKAELSAVFPTSSAKSFDGKLTICFVGRLEEAKGLGNLLLAIKELSAPSRFQSLLVVGNGENRAFYEKLGNESVVPVVFKGALNRNELNSIYQQSHLLILPSRSEGFPKVVAEAFAFGCIPIVTDISSLYQYIQHGTNGFLLPDSRPGTIKDQLDKISYRNDLKRISGGALTLADRFTYEIFNGRIAREVFALHE